MTGTMGSPPRMRGKPRERCGTDAIRGITPAHAGKTKLAFIADYNGRDHPRACGENRNFNSGRSSGKGSPPRMRGKPAVSCFAAIYRGITPAHAGKTLSFVMTLSSLWDHPRACGENTSRSCLSTEPKGSPPRMRGKLPVAPF